MNEEKNMIDICNQLFSDAAKAIFNNRYPNYPNPDYSVFQKFDFDYCCAISWRLNEPRRKNKRSRIINLILAIDILNDYDSALERDKEQMKKCFLDFLNSKVSEFDPKHDRLWGQSVPVEKWIFSCKYWYDWYDKHSA